MTLIELALIIACATLIFIAIFCIKIFRQLRAFHYDYCYFAQEFLIHLRENVK